MISQARNPAALYVCGLYSNSAWGFATDNFFSCLNPGCVLDLKTFWLEPFTFHSINIHTFSWKHLCFCFRGSKRNKTKGKEIYALMKQQYAELGPIR